MADDANDDNKEFEPTQRRLDEARRKGEVARAPDLTAAAALGGLTLALMLFGPWTSQRLGGTLAGLIGSVGHGDVPDTGAILLAILTAVAPLLLVPGLAALVVLFVQDALVFSAEKLALKPERLNPVRNAKQKFGPDGLVEFLKAAAKLAATSIVLVLFLSGRVRELIASAALDARQGLLLLLQLLVSFLAVSALVGGVIGLFDWLWQRFRHRARLRMSRQEMKEELKHSEGDPHIKRQRRQRGHDIATNRMLLEVPKADVVVVNPTHYAVALRWDRKPGRAPVCVAKGVDQVAARIREAAMAAGVPIQPDPPTARALHAAVEIGHEIPPELYRAVAASIRFAEAMRRRARQRGGQ